MALSRRPVLPAGGRRARHLAGGAQPLLPAALAAPRAPRARSASGDAAPAPHAVSEGAGAPTRRAVARAVSWVALGHGVSQGLWLGSLLLLAALLDPRDFGTVASALVLVNLAGLLVDSGTRGSLIAKPSITRADVRGAILLNAGMGIVLTAAIALAAGPAVNAFAAGGDVAAVRVLSVGVFLYALGITAFALLQKRLRLKEYAAANIA